jgi:DNA-binding Xre family transcriptional regulator
MKEREITYSQLSRRAGIGMQTAKDLAADPCYQMGIDTLYKCCKFFGVAPSDLLVEEQRVSA